MNRRGFGSILVRHLGGVFGSVLLVPTSALAHTLARKLRSYRIRYQERPKASIHTTIVQGYNVDDAKRRLRRRHPDAVFLGVEEVGEEQ